MTTAPLGRMLRVYRASQDISQKVLAETIGIEAATLCRIEDGKTGDQKTVGLVIAWILGATS
jgi:DNA-binding XRE family transcriptional regulator